MREQNDYHIGNPDGVSRGQAEQKIFCGNELPHPVAENSLNAQVEVTRAPETFSGGAPPQNTAPKSVNISADQLRSAATPASTASATTTAATTATTTTTAATSTATAATAATAATTATAAAATVTVSGIGAVAATVAASVATAVIVVTVFISTLTVNLALLITGMDRLVFEIQLHGAQEEDFETNILVTITDGDGLYQAQELRPDLLYVTFEGLAPGKEYTVRVANEDQLFFEKTYITATEETERAFLDAWAEKDEVFVFVGGVELDPEQIYTVTARDRAGTALFVRDGVETHGQYSFTVDETVDNVYLSLSTGGRSLAVARVEIFRESAAGEWVWADDCSGATYLLRDGTALQAEVTSEVLIAPTCEESGSTRYTAAVEIDGEPCSDERVLTVAALGHDYAEHVIEWTANAGTFAAGGYAADLVMTCSHDPTHVERVQATVTRDGDLFIADAYRGEEHYSDEIAARALTFEDGAVYLRANDYVQAEKDGAYTEFANSLTSPYLISGEITAEESIEIYNYTDMMNDAEGRGNGQHEVFYLLLEDGTTVTAEEGYYAVHVVANNDTDVYIRLLGSATLCGNTSPAIFVESMEECTINIYLFAEFAFESLYCADPTTADMWLYSYDSPSAINVYMNGEPVNEYGQEPHVHNFTYEAEPGTQLGASITAICSEENCDLPDNCVSLILYPPEIETEGDVEHAYASLDAEAFNAATGLDVTESDIRYYDSNDTLLEEAPTTAGDYTARITVQGQTASVAYTINQA